MHLKWGLRSSWGYGLELLETLLVLIQVFTGKSCGLVQGSEEPDRFCKERICQMLGWQDL